MIDDIAFIYLATVAVLAGIAMVLVRSPVRSAVSLVVVVFHVAGLFAVVRPIRVAMIWASLAAAIMASASATAMR